MKTIVSCLLVLCLAFAYVQSIELVDDETNETTKTNNEVLPSKESNDIPQNESNDPSRDTELVSPTTDTEVVTEDNSSSQHPCESCPDEATGCSVREVTNEDGTQIDAEVKCLDGFQVLKETSSRRPNPYPGVIFERQYFEAHLSFGDRK